MQVVLCKAYLSVGQVYEGQLKFQLALDMFKKSLEAAQSSADLSCSFTKLGNTYTMMGEFDLALDVQKKHLECTQKSGDRFSESSVYGHLGATYNNMGETQKACVYFERCINIAVEIGANATVKVASGLLREVRAKLEVIL